MAAAQRDRARTLEAAAGSGGNLQGGGGGGEEKGRAQVESSCSFGHGCATLCMSAARETSVYTWGLNKFAECGHGDILKKTVPKRVRTVTSSTASLRNGASDLNPYALSFGPAHALAIVEWRLLGGRALLLEGQLAERVKDESDEKEKPQEPEKEGPKKNVKVKTKYSNYRGSGGGESGPKTLKTSKLKKDEEVDPETKAKGAFSHRTMRLEREERERALKAAEEKERKLQAEAEDTPKEEAKGKGKRGKGKKGRGDDSDDDAPAPAGAAEETSGKGKKGKGSRAEQRAYARGKGDDSDEGVSGGGKGKGKGPGKGKGGRRGLDSDEDDEGVGEGKSGADGPTMLDGVGSEDEEFGGKMAVRSKGKAKKRELRRQVAGEEGEGERGEEEEGGGDF